MLSYITPIDNPHPLDTASALTLIAAQLKDARRQAAYYADRVAALEAAQAEWQAKA